MGVVHKLAGKVLPYIPVPGRLLRSWLLRKVVCVDSDFKSCPILQEKLLASEHEVEENMTPVKREKRKEHLLM